MAVSTANPPRTNPVYGSYFADPFVWKHNGVYYAIGTGSAEATGHAVGKIFPVLQSTDFVQWHFASSALAPPDHALGDTFWAPAVAWFDGTFFLYYSVGHGDKGHQLRVATSAEPQGPYNDLGVPLLDPQNTVFAIDPHPFQDLDGQWYLFYACDFLDRADNARVGTALKVHRLKNMTQLESAGRTVLRARSDWQRFQSPRQMYGEVWDWHTLEGPCLVRHEDLYYCFYSGGRWENESYGVDYGVASSVIGPYSDAGNETGPRVLRTISNCVVGPGHNSWIAGPNGIEYLVYHAWDKEMKSRQMFIDELQWTADGPRCVSTFARSTDLSSEIEG